MTTRRWIALLSLIAFWTVEASHLPVLGGEITTSAAKVFLTAASAGEKSAPAATPTPATATPASIDAHSAAAMPPTLEETPDKAASPNVLRPTAEQQAARVTPVADESTIAAGKSSRRAPTSLPLPTLSTPVSAAPTLAPPQALPTAAPVPNAAPILVAEKSARPAELKTATPESAVTKKIEPIAPAETSPALQSPTLAVPSSQEPAKLPHGPAGESTVKDDHSIGFDPATGKTYRNVLRSGSPSIAVPHPAPASEAKKPEVIELTPSFNTAAKPTTAPQTISQPVPEKAVSKTPTSIPHAGTTSTSSRSPAAVVSDAPISTPTPRPNSMLTPGDEPPSQKAVVSKAPAQPETKKLFEATQPAPLTADQEALRRRVQSSLATYYQNWTLNTREHSPWEVMHAIIAYGVDTQLNHNGKPITAIGHLCFSGVCNKLSIVSVKNGRLYMNRGPGVQGHAGQFLAIVAQSQLQRDYPLYAAGKEYTMEDLIKAEQYDCESGTELTFKLIGLMHYLPSDAEWTNFQGQKWSLDRLVREEIVQPVRGAACGGTHRLMGLSYAIRKREQRGEPITGIYAEAEKYIAQYHKYTRGLQNPDGSFSTAWFVRREARLDLDRRLQTTGHILEWLCFSLNDEQLREPWVTKTVKYVTDLLLDETQHEWEIGHLGHALHALQMYNERMYDGPIRSYEGMVSRRPIKTAKQSTPNSNQ